MSSSTTITLWLFMSSFVFLCRAAKATLASGKLHPARLAENDHDHRKMLIGGHFPKDFLEKTAQLLENSKACKQKPEVCAALKEKLNNLREHGNVEGFKREMDCILRELLFGDDDDHLSTADLNRKLKKLIEKLDKMAISDSKSQGNFVSRMALLGQKCAKHVYRTVSDQIAKLPRSTQLRLLNGVVLLTFLVSPIPGSVSGLAAIPLLVETFHAVAADAFDILDEEEDDLM